MASHDRTIAVKVETLGYDYGLWCNRCMLPSGIRVHVVISYGPWAHMQTGVVCRDCESDAFIDED